MFGTVTPQEMQAARLLVGLTMAAFLLPHFFPRHRQFIWRTIAIIYLSAAVAFSAYVLLR